MNSTSSKFSNLIRQYSMTYRRLVTSAKCFKSAKRSTVRSIQSRGDFTEGGYILLAIPAITFGLGTWQVQRRKWKLGLIEELEEKTHAPPVPMPVDQSELEGLEYRKVLVRGHFDHSREAYLGPRSRVEGSEHTGGGLITANRSQSGMHVVTAFIADNGMEIMVNRGWIPRNMIDPRTRPEGQISGEVELVGVVRKTEKRAQFAPKNDPGRQQYHHRDLAQLSALLGTEQVFIDADSASSVQGGPIGGQTRISLRNEHFSYIMTWYSLSAITFAMWYRKYWLRR